MNNAKTLQEDILRSKRLADDIVQQSEAPQVSGKATQDAEEHAQFLEKEVLYTQQLHEVLRGIQQVNELLGEVEQAMNERRIVDSLRWLESMASSFLSPGEKADTCRIMGGARRSARQQESLSSYETVGSTSVRAQVARSRCFRPCLGVTRSHRPGNRISCHIR